MNVVLSRNNLFLFFFITIKLSLKISAHRFTRITVGKTFIVVCFLADVIQNFLPWHCKMDLYLIVKKKKSVFPFTTKNIVRTCVRPSLVHVNQLP